MTRSISVFYGVVGCALLSNAQEDWTAWPQCVVNQEFVYTPPEVDPTPVPPGQIVDEDFEDYRRRRQIIEMNWTTQELRVNPDADLWNWLQEEDGQDESVHVITVFGGPSTGKSTMASFLGCAMHEERAFLFPAYAPTDDDRTRGVWASMPFLYKQKKYMILDMPSEAPLNDGGSAADELMYKVTALLSEVTSIFLYTAETPAEDLRTSHYNAITKAMETTRSDLVWRAKENEVLPPGQGDLKIINKPALAIITREGYGADLLNDNYQIDDAQFKIETEQAFTALETDDALAAALFNENFVKRTRNGKEVPFVVLPLVTVDTDDGSADNAWDWGAFGPYDLERHGACEVFNTMQHIKCKANDIPGSIGESPHPAPVYHQAVMHLASELEKHAVTRILEEDGLQQPLYGRRLREVIENGVDQMNAIGPLPRSALWARLMEDRCETEIIKDIGLTFGTETGDFPPNHPTKPGQTVTGQLGQLQKTLDDAVAKDTTDLTEVAVLQKSGKWEELTDAWDAAYDNGNGLEQHVDQFFLDRVLMQTVEGECSKAGLARSEVLEISFTAINNSFTAKFQRNRAIVAAKRAAELERQLKLAQDGQTESAFWESWDENRFLYIGLAVLSCIILGVIAYFFSHAARLCRSCLSCCGDYGDKKTNLIVVRS